MATKSEIARHLNVSRAQVTRWSARGMPCQNAEAAREWHSSHIRTRRKRGPAQPPAAGAGVSGNGEGRPANARDRLDLAKAQLAELDLALRQGRLLWADDVSKSSRRAGMTIRDGMLSIPGRIAAQLVGVDDEREIERLLTQAIRAELTRLAQSATAST